MGEREQNLTVILGRKVLSNKIRPNQNIKPSDWRGGMGDAKLSGTDSYQHPIGNQNILGQTDK